MSWHHHCHHTRDVSSKHYARSDEIRSAVYVLTGGASAASEFPQRVGRRAGRSGTQASDIGRIRTRRLVGGRQRARRERPRKQRGAALVSPQATRSAWRGVVAVVVVSWDEVRSRWGVWICGDGGLPCEGLGCGHGDDDNDDDGSERWMWLHGEVLCGAFGISRLVFVYWQHLDAGISH